MVRRALTVSLFVFAGTFVGAPALAANPTATGSAQASAQSELIALINVYRSMNGRQAVSANGALGNAAAWMANDMASRNYVGHVSSDGRSPTQRMLAFGYPATTMFTGENLGAGHVTASAVLAGWKGSVAHNAVLLNPNYNVIGVGVTYNASSTYKWYWTADFGGPGGTVKVVVPPPAPAQQPAGVRAAVAPRGNAPPVSVDAEARALDTRAQFLAQVGERRIVHLIAVLMGRGVL